MALPQANRCDHEPILIHQSDRAWNRDVLDYERDVMRGDREPEHGRPVPPGKWTDHPWVQYVNGTTRGDLAPVEHYLEHRDGDLGPTRFRYKRIEDMVVWAQIKSLEDQGLIYQSRVFALRCSLVEVDGVKLQGGRNGEQLTGADVKALRNAFGDVVFEDAAAFAVRISRSITEAEKKP